MEKTVGAFEIRRRLGRILQDVAARGDRIVVERHGEPVAAVVPIEVYEQWKRARSEFFANARATAARANLSPAEADALVDEAIAAARAERGRSGPFSIPPSSSAATSPPPGRRGASSSGGRPGRSR